MHPRSYPRTCAGAGFHGTDALIALGRGIGQLAGCVAAATVAGIGQCIGCAAAAIAVGPAC